MQEVGVDVGRARESPRATTMIFMCGSFTFLLRTWIEYAFQYEILPI